MKDLKQTIVQMDLTHATSKKLYEVFDLLTAGDLEIFDVIQNDSLIELKSNKGNDLVTCKVVNNSNLPDWIKESIVKLD